MTFEKSESRNGKSTATDHIDPRTTDLKRCSLKKEERFKRLTLLDGPTDSFSLIVNHAFSSHHNTMATMEEV
jgi:hypothetical protein